MPYPKTQSSSQHPATPSLPDPLRRRHHRRRRGARRLAAALVVAAWVTSLLVAAPDPASAATAAPDGTAGWRTSPLWGADVRSLAIDPRDPSLVFAGTSAGQIYVSHDGGQRWIDAGSPLPFRGSWVVSGLAFDPDHPGRLWAALRGIWSGGHVAFTDDYGEHWVSRGRDLHGVGVHSMVLVPCATEGGCQDDDGRPAGTLYAGTSDGVWGTTDGGVSWAKMPGQPDGLQAKVTSLYLDPRDSRTLLAGTWRRAYRTRDGGQTWAGIFDGMLLDSEVFALVPTGRADEIWAPTCNWVYQSLDGGSSWQRFETGLDQRRVTSFAALTTGRLLAGTVTGLYVSDDRGRSWRRTSSTDLAVLSIAHHPSRPERVLLGTEGSGVWVSDDRGETFARSARGMTNLRVAAIASTERRGGARGTLWAAVNHAGPATGIYASTDGGASFPGRLPPLPTVLDLALAPAGGTGTETLWAGTERGLYELRDGSWVHHPETGEGRIEQLLADDGRLVVVTGGGVWTIRAGALAKTPYHHGPPRSAALHGDSIWVTDADGLYRVQTATNDRTPAPTGTGSVASLGDRLLYADGQGLWTRDPAGETWRPLATGKALRLLPTGDAARPLLMVGDDGRVGLWSRQSGAFETVEVPVPAREILDAHVAAGRLYLGTSGYGLLSRDLDVD